ncbi:hypothetical protein APHAL10511_006922 [Amanita phalloides]|nr:hypothetical protein APHAL10511_006922 [Amanita phalloides]
MARISSSSLPSIMNAFISSTANVGAGRQPLTSILIRPWDIRNFDIADHFTEPLRVHFEKEPPVARSPELRPVNEDEEHIMVTIPMAGRCQTPIRRRMRVVYEVVSTHGVLKRFWNRTKLKLASLCNFNRRKSLASEDVEDDADPFVIVCRTPDRLTRLASPPLLLPRNQRNAEDEEVSEKMREEYGAWARARIDAARRYASY